MVPLPEAQLDFSATRERIRRQIHIIRETKADLCEAALAYRVLTFLRVSLRLQRHHRDTLWRCLGGDVPAKKSPRPEGAWRNNMQGAA